MQKIALENNLSETAFLVPEGDGFNLRWFTPKAEVKLCGHATLAAAHVLFHHFSEFSHDQGRLPLSSDQFGGDTLCFQTLSGELSVQQRGDELVLNFPAQQTKPCAIPEGLEVALGVTPLECEEFEDLLVRLNNEEEVATLNPDINALVQLNFRGIIVTAPGANGSDADFVSRFFAPAVGVNEDPVTGSAHTRLTPYWAQRLRKKKMTARQLSQRGGKLSLELVSGNQEKDGVEIKGTGDRVLIAGTALTYLIGTITV